MLDAEVLRVVGGPSTGRQVPLGGRIVIGRAEGTLRIDDAAVSRTHAAVQTGEQGEVTVADAGSSRGTTIDGKPVTTPVPFPLGATVRVGRSAVRRLRVVKPSGEGAEVMLRRTGGEQHPHRVSARTTVGRESGSDIRIDDPAVSRRHLVLDRIGGRLTVEDAGSRGGVLVNGRRIDAPVVVREGDEIEIGGTDWVLIVAGGTAAASPREFRIRVEGESAMRAVSISADAGSTVGDVAAAAATQLLVDHPYRVTFYRDDDGVLLHPDALWASVALVRGELLVLAVFEPSGVDPALSGRIGDVDPRPSGSRIVRSGGRAIAPPESVALDLPPAPETAALKGRGVGWQLAGASIGVLGGITIAFVLNNWLFAVIGSVAGVGAAVFSILGDQSRRRHRVREYDRAVERVAREADAAAASQASVLVALSPTPDAWASLLSTGSVWDRQPGDPDFLRLRLGTGSCRAAVRIVRPGGEPPPESAEAVSELVADRLLADVPVRTPGGGVFGITGSNRDVDALVRSLVIDAAVHHAPSILSIHILADAGEAEFALWLPHTADGARSRIMSGSEPALVAERVAADRAEGRKVLLVARQTSATAWGELLRGWRDEDGLVVVTSRDPAGMPQQAACWAVLEHDGAHAAGAWPDGPVGAFVPDRLDHDSAGHLALLASGLVDAHLAGRHTFTARGLLELSGVDVASGDDLIGNWGRARGPLNAVLGTSDDGSPVEVQLRHTVIAGTTGSGKSELLATLLASLIARQSPEDLSLFLIDFKGGATFDRFAAAPHVVGVVTDLESDERLARRAFQALDVELRRRKALLGAARVSDIDRYREQTPGRSLPSLLVVIDEFALLAQTIPDVKVRLDTIAAQGRSLGIFLVLATQSPAGVVTPAIRANTDLWLSLRVVSDQESREILGTADAARLPVDAPGRALVRRGAEDRLVPFQTARVTVTTASTGVALVTVRPFGDATSSWSPITRSDTGQEPDDLEILLAKVQDAARIGRFPRPERLWLPPLPPEVVIDDLPDTVLAGLLPVRVGLADLLSQQEQPAYVLDLAATGLLVTGAPRSGRSGVLLQVAADLAERNPPSAVHLYGLHADGALDGITGLPHVGGVVQVNDGERTERLLGRLTALVEQRRSTERTGDEPRIVLLVDDYPAVRDVLEQRLLGRLHDQLVALVIAGRPSGVHVVLATPQPTDVRMALMAGLGHRILLKVVDRVDYQAIAARPVHGEEPPGIPGRGMTANGIEVQVLTADLRRARELARAWPEAGRPAPVRALPGHVSLGELVPSSSDEEDVIGVGGREVGPVALDARPGAHVVVLGEAGTGRSTALLAVARAHLIRPGARVLVFAPRGGPLEVLLGHPQVRAYRADGADALLVDASNSADGTLIVIDDSERWPPTASEGLERVLRQARDGGQRAAVAARAGDWSRSFDGWIRYLASLKSALLLSGFGELGPGFDVRLDAPPDPRPGRGYLVARGRAELVQVATA